MDGLEDVVVFAAPWPGPGWRSDKFFGPISSEVFLPDSKLTHESLYAAMEEADDAIKAKARLFECNAILALEKLIDPFYVKRGVPGLLFRWNGTAASVTCTGGPPFF